MPGATDPFIEGLRDAAQIKHNLKRAAGFLLGLLPAEQKPPAARPTASTPQPTDDWDRLRY